jgi:hypothetical protein
MTLALTLSACADAYKAAAKVADDLTKAVSSGIKISAELSNDGVTTLEERNNVLRFLDKLTDFNGVYKSKVRTIHAAELACAASKCNKAAEYISAANELVSAAKDPSVLALAHVSNPSSQKKVERIVTAINVVLDGAVLAIQRVKGQS